MSSQITSEFMPNGMLRCRGTVARANIWLRYQTPNGYRDEWVPEETLFNRESLDSLAMTPLTLGHPSEPVTPSNYTRHAIGGSSLRVICNRGRGTVDLVFAVGDESAIAVIRSGKVRQLSCGYDCQVEKRSDGSIVQTRRIYNHVALCELARAQGAQLYYA